MGTTFDPQFFQSHQLTKSLTSPPTHQPTNQASMKTALILLALVAGAAAKDGYLPHEKELDIIEAAEKDAGMSDESMETIAAYFEPDDMHIKLSDDSKMEILKAVMEGEDMVTLSKESDVMIDEQLLKVPGISDESKEALEKVIEDGGHSLEVKLSPEVSDQLMQDGLLMDDGTLKMPDEMEPSKK